MFDQPFNIDHNSVVIAILDILAMFYRRFETTFFFENQSFFMEYLQKIDEILGYYFLNFLQYAIQELSVHYLDKSFEKFEKNVFGYLSNNESNSNNNNKNSQK